MKVIRHQPLAEPCATALVTQYETEGWAAIINIFPIKKTGVGSCAEDTDHAGLPAACGQCCTKEIMVNADICIREDRTQSKCNDIVHLLGRATSPIKVKCVQRCSYFHESAIEHDLTDNGPRIGEKGVEARSNE